MEDERYKIETPVEADRTPGSATIQGQKFEYLMLALIYLRSIKCASRFHLGSNLAGLGQFDDIFLDLYWTDAEGQERRQVYCLQLKHKDKGGCVQLNQLKVESGKYSILQYYKSYCDIEDSSKGRTETKNRHILQNVNFDDMTFCLFTNAVCTHKSENLIDFNLGERLINTRLKQECVFSMGPKDDVIWNSKNGCEDEERFRKFLSKLLIFSNQVHADQLPELIRQEIMQVAGKRWHDSEALCQKFMDSMQEWWSKNHVLLSENSDLWYKSLMEDMNRKMVTALHKVRCHFKQECSESLIKLLRKGICLNVVVPDIHRKVRCLKIASALESKFQGHYLLMDSNEVIRKKDHIISLCGKGFCDILVIDVQIFPGLQKLISGINTKGITTVLVSGRKIDNIETVYQDSWSIDQFSELSQKHLLQTDVELQGEEVPLSDLCRGEMTLSLSSKMIGALAQRSRVQFGTLRTDDVDVYIPRTFRHQTPLLEDILRVRHERDVLGVSGYPQEGSSFALDNGHSKNENIHILSYVTENSASNEMCLSSDHPDRAAYMDLCTRHSGSKNVHWIVFQDGWLYWKETFGRNNLICKYIKKLSERCREEVDCSHSAEFLDDWTERLRFITGEPGIGKSTLLKQIAALTKERNPGSWVVLVELINFTNDLQKMSNGVTLENIVDLLADAAGVSKSTCPTLAKKLIVDSLVTSGNIIVFLDAVDEVTPIHTKEVLSIVQFLLDTQTSEIWTTSRSILQQQLQKELSVIPLVLQPFTEGEMREFFTRYFSKQTDSDHSDVDNMYRMVVELTDNIKTKETASSASRNLCAIPLHAKMTADTIKDLVRDSTDKLVKLNLNRLYEYFLNMKLTVYYQKYGIDLSKAAFTCVTDRETEHFIDNHIKCALFVTFEQEDLRFLEVHEVKRSVASILQKIEYEKTGLIDGVFDGKPRFIHFTICEYLVARWFRDSYEKKLKSERNRANRGLILHLSSEIYLFARMILDSCKSNKSRSQKTNKYEMLMEPRLNIVRSFFDEMLADGFIMHEAVLNGDSDKVERAVNSGLPVESVDRGGRLPLHLAAAHGHTEAVHVLLGAESPVEVRDAVLGWTPLRYADRVGAWSVADVLLQHGAKYRDMPIFNSLVKTQGAIQTFMSAVLSGHVDLMRLMLREWGMQTISHSYKISALTAAAANGNKDAVKLLICNNTDVNGFDRQGNTPMTHAVECRDEKSIILLEELGADINGRNKFGNTPLITAVLQRDLEMMEFLLELGADINFQDDSGCTPLYISVRQKFPEVSTFLHKKGADVDYRNKDGVTALLKAIQCKDQAIMKALLDMKADVNCPDKYGETPLHKCIHSNDQDTLKLLLAYGADLNYDHTDGDTLLYKAIKRKDKQTIKLLLEFGADPNCASSDGYTPLNHAVYTRDRELMQQLILYKADINFPINKGWTLLHKAILNKDRETVKWLLDFGADVNLAEPDGETPLLRALEHQDKETIKMLLERQADVNRTNRESETPLHKAVMYMNTDIVKLLLSFNGNPNAQDNEGCTSLHAAMTNWNPEIQKLLIENGADVQISNNNGKTPLALAQNRKVSATSECVSISPVSQSASFIRDAQLSV